MEKSQGSPVRQPRSPASTRLDLVHNPPLVLEDSDNIFGDSEGESPSPVASQPQNTLSPTLAVTFDIVAPDAHEHKYNIQAPIALVCVCGGVLPPRN